MYLHRKRAKYRDRNIKLQIKISKPSLILNNVGVVVREELSDVLDP